MTPYEEEIERKLAEADRHLRAAKWAFVVVLIGFVLMVVSALWR